MKEFCYYPGCTLKTKAKELDIYAKRAAEALDVKLTEIPEWQCCGAVYPLAADEIASRLSSVRALQYAKEQEQPLITLCSACHHVIKRVNDDMIHNDDIRLKANNYLEYEVPYEGEAKVLHYIEMLNEVVGFEELKKRVTNPLSGKKIAAYYGCMLLRPGSVMAFDDPENPTIMEEMIAALGATPVVFPYRNECCGGYAAVTDPSQPERMSKNIVEMAREQGAEAIITACPLCRYSLEQYGSSEEKNIPVYYFTELLAEALGVKELEGDVAYAG